MTLRRTLTVAAVMAGMTVVAPLAPAGAASAPSNDSWAGALTIGGLPYRHVEDTSTATTGPADRTVLEQCGPPATNGSVWFRYKPTTDQTIGIDASASDFSTGVAVVSGPRDAQQIVGCAPGSTSADLVAGVTYHLMAFSDTPEVVGGRLVLKVRAVTPPEVTFVLDPVATVTRDGYVTLTGTVACTSSDPIDSAWVYGDLRQQLGRVALTAFFENDPETCTATPQPWSSTFRADNGRLGPGSAEVSYAAGACTTFTCVETPGTMTVRLRRG